MANRGPKEVIMGEAKRRKLAAQAAGVPLEPKTVKSPKLPRSITRMLPAMLAGSVSSGLPDGLRPTTPTEPLSDQVRELCVRVSPGAEPILLPLTDTGGYRAGQCHMNVLHSVREHGGERVNGWMIWECAMFAEAEFHCVWRSTTGELIDITPRRDGEATVLFLPDPEMRLTRGPRGGFMQPTNRTTAAGMPYAVGGMPYPHDAAEVVPDQATRTYCEQFGIDPLEVCD
jgi:hypothetical protein